MYDTIHLFLSRDEAAGSDVLACLSSLQSVSETLADDRCFYKGTLSNLSVLVNDGGVRIKGSLAKYYLNDNIRTLTRGDTVAAIERLCDDLHLPVKKARVTRIDFAQNLLMRHEPEAYFQYLGDSQYYQRLLQPKSLYYNNQRRVKLFYNKLAEAKVRQVSIPDVVAGQNLMRFELRFVSRLPKQLKTEVTAGHLTDEAFYMELVNRWVMEYKNIQKNNLINLNHEQMNSPKDFWRQGTLHWLKLIGVDTALRLVDDMKARNVFEKPEYYSRLKREIKEMSSQPELTERSELIAELDEKVGRARMYYR